MSEPAAAPDTLALRRCNIFREHLLEFIETVQGTDTETLFEVGSEFGMFSAADIPSDRRAIVVGLSSLLSAEVTRRQVAET